MQRALFLVAVAASFALGAAAASGSVRGTSTLHVVVDSTDVDHSDPALSYSTIGWQTEYEDCATLVGYPDRSGKVSTAVEPIGAAGMPVITNHGKKYVFTIKNGMKFSNGDPITAANYKYAFDRDALHKLYSPVTAFVGVVKGWEAENTNPSIRSVSGVTASGTGAGKLTIILNQADGTLLPVLALPFFCPLDKTAPFWNGSAWADSEVNAPWPGSGPYYLASRTVGSQMVLQRNPYYDGTQQATADTIVVDTQVSQSTAYAGISNGTYAADLNGNPEPSQNQALAKQFGINKSRLRVNPTLITTYLAMNERGKIFKSVGVRKGVNYTIDRPGLIATGGYLSATPTVQLLPRPLAGGAFSTKLYPTTTPNAKQFAEARKLSNNCGVGHTKPLYIWSDSGSYDVQRTALISDDLEQMGCTDVVVEYLCGYCGHLPPNPYDILLAGWGDDYPDGYDFLHPLLDGRTIGPDNNNDLSYFNNANFNKRLDAANRLEGAARNTAFGKLDQWAMTKFAPIAPISNVNFVDYLSANARGYVYNGPFSSVDLGYLYQS